MRKNERFGFIPGVPNSDFEFGLCMPDPYEDMICEIQYKGHLVMILNQEKGIDNLEVEVDERKIPLKYLLKTLEYAKQRLWELRRDDQQDLKLEDYQ